jgi:hypothetical protein
VPGAAGDSEQLLRAVALLLTKLVESPHYARFTTSNVSYGMPPQVRRAACMHACMRRHACAGTPACTL